MKAPKKYLNRLKVTIDFLLGKPKKNFTPGTFHKLRIELKKLNSFFNLINFCSKDFRKKKTYKPFREIFKSAGKVREIQLQEAMLKKYFPDNSTPEYKAFLRKNRLDQKRIFFLLFETKLITQIKNKFNEVKTFLPKIKTKQATIYLENEEEKIKNLINKRPLKKNHLHELRKRLKTLNNIRSSLALENNKNLNFANKTFPNLLGDWHDLQVMIDHLDIGIEKGGINPNEVIHLETLKSKISAKSELLFNQIQMALPDSEFFAKNNITQNPTT